MKQLDRRQRILLLALLGVAALIIILLVPVIIREEADEDAPPVAVIPEADLAEGDDSKTGSYRREPSIASYWDSLEPQQENEPPQESGSGGRHPARVDVDDLFGDCKESPAPRREGSGAAPKRKNEAQKDNTPSPTAVVKDERADSSEARTAAVPGNPSVKRSGAVSSLDEDVASDLGSGFSTLDGTDRWVGSESGKAYRCMFTRDEKVRSGQRVTVRLLEDLVIGGVHIPRNTHLQGVASISNRLEVRISSLDMGGRILSLRFEAYDTDGGRGIYCSDLSEARRTASDQAVSTASSSMNSRLGRAARDVVSVGASIVRSKNGEATVSVPAGYSFYIIETNR